AADRLMTELDRGLRHAVADQQRIRRLLPALDGADPRVATIEMRRAGVHDEPLRSSAVTTGVRNADTAGDVAGRLDGDRRLGGCREARATPAGLGRIAALDDEVGHDAMELDPVVEVLAREVGDRRDCPRG